MFIEIHDYLAQKRQDAREAYDYARAVGTPEPTLSDIQLFMDTVYEQHGVGVLDITQEQRDQIVFNIINAK